MPATPLKKTASSLRLLSTSALALGLMSVGAQAMDDFTTPTGEQVVGGSASFDRPADGQLNIHQNTDRVVINWNAFNIGAKAKTEFFQPNSGSLAVNRVTGANQDPTRILGTLKSNGKVMVLDRNGIFFGKDAVLDVGGIVASTGDVDNAAVMRGDSVLGLSNFGDASVVNEGTITVSGAGLAAFVAPHVSNSGLIQARVGKVALASGGERATVDLYGDGLVELAVDTAKGRALVDNSGRIEASNVLLTASAAKEVVDTVVNMGGVVKANSVSVQGGKIVLSAGGSGKVKVTGTLDASGETGGGTIRVTGKDVEVTETALISADAGQNGDGGDIRVIGDNLAIFRGNLTARGGALSGNGGFAEVSGYQGLDYQGLADLTAANGEIGSLLLDPRFTVIHSGAFLPGIFQQYVLSAAVLALNLKTANVTLQADEFIDVGTRKDGYNLNVGNPVTNALLNAFLNGLADGDINLSTWSFLWSSGQTAGSLTLDAPTVNFNRNLTMGKGNLSVDATTINLDSRIYGLNKGSTVLFDETRMSSNVLDLNVLSNAALIQQGVDLAASGATIDVGAGTYAEDVVVDKSVTLRGANAGVNPNTGTRGDETVLAPAATAFHVTGDNVTVDGFEVVGGSTGVFVDNADNASILNNVILKVSGVGVHAVGGKTVSILQNAVFSAGTDGINVGKNGGVVTVSSNNVEYSGDEGIEIRNSDDVTADGNTISYSGDDGLQVANAYTKVRLGGNTVSVSGSDGIEVHNAIDLVMSGNTSNDSNDQGIEIVSADGAYLSSNQVDGTNRAEGVFVTQSSDVTLYYNFVYDTEGDGIKIVSSDRVSIDANTVDGTNHDGIGVHGGNNVSISYNTVTNVENDGIYAGDMYDFNYDYENYEWLPNLTISYNTVDGADGNGIAVENVLFSKITGNKVGLNPGHCSDESIGGVGIFVTSESYDDPTEITGNFVANAGEEGILVSNVDTVTINDNTIWNVEDGIVVYGADYDVQINGNYIGVAREVPYGEGDTILVGGEGEIDGDGISVWESGYVEINENQIANVGDDGIDVERVNRARIIGNLITTTGDDGIVVEGVGGGRMMPTLMLAEVMVEGDYDPDAQFDLVIRQNVITDAGQLYAGEEEQPEEPEEDFPEMGREIGMYEYEYEYDGDGIDVSYSGSVKIDGNTVTNAYDDGIVVADSGNGYDECGKKCEYQPRMAMLDYEVYENPGVVIVDNTVSESGSDGIQVSELSKVLIERNLVNDSGANGLFVSGAYNGSVKLVANTFSNNPVGALFQSGLIDLTGEGNTFNGGAVGMQFDPAVQEVFVGFEQVEYHYQYWDYELEEFVWATSYYSIPVFEEQSAELALVDDTIGSMIFNGQSQYYVELLDGALFNPGTPTLLNGLNATYDGFNPMANGGLMTEAQYNAIEKKLFHFIDQPDVGLFFFGLISEDGVTIAQEDVFNSFGGFNGPGSQFRVTILGLPRLPGSGGGTGGQSLTDILANIAPAAGGEGEGGEQPADLAELEPSAGADATGEPLDAACWSEALSQASNGASVDYNFGASMEDALNQAAACGSSL